MVTFVVAPYPVATSAKSAMKSTNWPGLANKPRGSSRLTDNGLLVFRINATAFPDSFKTLATPYDVNKSKHSQKEIILKAALIELNFGSFEFALESPPIKFVRMKLRALIGLLVLLAVLAGCKSAYYSAWEKFGVYKRDLLKRNVQAARDEEKAASEQFKDALTRLKEMYGFQGGDLEKSYNTMQKDYDRSVERANAVHKRVKDVDTVATDLFKEWQKEIGEISAEKLRADSQQKLHETQRRYDEMFAALKRAEKSMDPVLTRFHDQVLYLKHNLNAAAIASLKGESTDIQNEISRLLQDMNQAIARADQFINTLQ
jgi:hypothetical protein